jgi:hypothetical protein
MLKGDLPVAIIIRHNINLQAEPRELLVPLLELRQPTLW